MLLPNNVQIDLVAYGGAALGMVLAVLEFRAGRIPFWGCFAIIFLSADFFLPMRQLGSFFHIAMNGMAASDKIDPRKLLAPGAEAIKNTVKEKMELFGSVGKA